MKLTDYFDKIFMITLDGSEDRRIHAEAEFSKHDFGEVELFRAHDFRDYKPMPDNIRAGMENAMHGCTASHGAVLNIIGHAGYDKAMILEDDFEIFHDDFNERFEAMIPFIPEDWDILYLGAHYQDSHVPLKRINEHVIKVGPMFTTSSYAVRGKHARFIAPLVCGGGAVDALVSGFNELVNAYVLQPRLIGQYENCSTIWGKTTWNSVSMQDTRHESSV